jgi:hypothetical protein
VLRLANQARRVPVRGRALCVVVRKCMQVVRQWLRAERLRFDSTGLEGTRVDSRGLEGSRG